MLASLAFPNGRLTLARIDADPVETLIVATQSRRQAPTDIPRAASGKRQGMRIQIVSGLHLEFESPTPALAPDADVFVVAGDLAPIKRPWLLAGALERWRDAAPMHRFPPRNTGVTFKHGRARQHDTVRRVHSLGPGLR